MSAPSAVDCYARWLKADIRQGLGRWQYSLCTGTQRDCKPLLVRSCVEPGRRCSKLHHTVI